MKASQLQKEEDSLELLTLERATILSFVFSWRGFGVFLQKLNE
jgi:hypothetical protein